MIHLPTLREILALSPVLASVGIAKRQLSNPQSGGGSGSVTDVGSLGLARSEIRFTPTAATTFLSQSPTCILGTTSNPGSGTPTCTVSGANTPGDVQLVGAALNASWDGVWEGTAAANNFAGVSINFMKSWGCCAGATQVGLNFGTFFGLLDFSNHTATTWGQGLTGVGAVGFIIRPTDSNWQAMTSTGIGVGQSYVNTGVAPVTSQPQFFKMDFTSSGLMKYFINGTQVAVINQTFPAASVKLAGFYGGFTASNSFNAKFRFAFATWQWGGA